MEKELRELFCVKIGLENARFKKKMLKQSAEVLFERAYQIDTMINLYELLMEMSQKMEPEALKTLLVFPNLLAFLYDRWIKEADSHMEELQCSLEKNVEELQEKYQKVKKEEMGGNGSMKRLVSTLNLDKKEWLKYRKQGIGGSDAGAVCGLNPYHTAMQVYQDKTSDEIEEIDNEAMRQGREFEDYVARRFTNNRNKGEHLPMQCFITEKYPFMLADVDRMVVGENATVRMQDSKSLYG